VSCVSEDESGERGGEWHAQVRGIGERWVEGGNAWERGEQQGAERVKEGK
jgi:hypothetical protein